MRLQAVQRIGVIVGSSRQGGNGAGIAQWLSSTIHRQINSSGQPVEVITVDPATAPLPLGPVIEGTRFPAQITNAADYASPAVQEWSKFVSSCAGLAIVSPEYNSGYPGELKNALDHLFHEWAGKPVLLLTYGAGGGMKASTQLQVVLPALKMRMLEDQVAIKLPPSYIAGTDRVRAGSEDWPMFLKEYEVEMASAVEQLAKSLVSPSPA